MEQHGWKWEYENIGLHLWMEGKSISGFPGPIYICRHCGMNSLEFSRTKGACPAERRKRMVGPWKVALEEAVDKIGKDG